MGQSPANFTRRRILQSSAAFAGLPLAHLALAQEKFPSKPIKIIVPLPAGGAADVAVRRLGQHMQEIMGQSVVVDNKPGGAFSVAMASLAQSPADGYTLIAINSAFLAVQALFKRLDVFKQLVPVVGQGATDETISVGGNGKFKTAKDLIAYGRANPGKLSYVTPGHGTLEHLAGYNFCKLNGFDAVNVPMKGGPDAAQALMGGQGDFGVIPLPLVQQLGGGGKLSALLVLNDHRNPNLPNVPTPEEAGVKATRCVIWGGLAAPVGTPPAVLATLEKVALEAARNPELQKAIATAGMVPAAVPAEAFGKMWRDDYAWISKAVTEADLKAQ